MKRKIIEGKWRFWQVVGMLVLSLLVFMPKSQALTVPSPSAKFYVLDQAQMISETAEAQFVSRSQALAATSGAQIALLTISSLEDESLEEYSLEVARKWGLGNEKRDNGVLILVVEDSHQIRIEVGYGLEEILPDGLTGRLQRTYLTPKFQAGDYDSGVLALQQALIETIQGKEVLTNAENEEEVSFASVIAIWLVIIGVWLSAAKNWWKKCPQCGKRTHWKNKTEKIGLTKIQTITTCKNCGYEKKGPIMPLGTRTGGFGGGGFSGGGSSGGGGSFGGGGSSGSW